MKSLQHTGIPADALRRLEEATSEILIPHLILTSASVRDALAAINSLSGDTMTLFAVSSDGRVVGTVTDGDIRRAILAGASPDDPVERVMFRSFMQVAPGEPLHEAIARARKKGVDLLPVTDDGFLTDMLDLRRLHTSLPLDAVMMAGGRGERLRPMTLETPKPLLKVGGKPIIDYNIEELRACGIRNIFVTVNYLKEQIIDHFSDASDVTCVEEPRRLGTMGSLTLAEGLSHDNLILMNSDLLTSLDFEKMYLHHIESGAELTVAAIPYNVSVPFAIMHTDGDRVTDLSEKPTFNYFANAGVYMLKRCLIDEMPRGEYLDAPDFIHHLIETGRKVSFFPIDGTWVDIGSPDDFRYANELMSQRRK